MVESSSPLSRGRSMASRILVFLLAVLTLSAGLRAAEQPKIAPKAALQLQALRGVKTSKSAVQNKIDSRLFLGLLHQRGDARLAPLTDFRFVRPEADGRVPVDILTTSLAGVKPVLSKLEAVNAVVSARGRASLQVSARVRLDDLEAIAGMPEVRKVRQHIPRLNHKINTSEGDATHGADEARGFFGVTGAGVKVCVLSDGVDSLSSLQSSGDLPPGIDVLDPGSGDEGSAMLEIIYDLAPGASLGFAQAGPDEMSFAANILALGSAPHNCNIIVDDIIYLDESPFEDGPVAQAVNTVTANGVLYFSSAGNEGNVDDLTSGTWEGNFNPSAAADPAPLAGANLHNFGDGGNSILVEFGGGNPPLLIWAEHYDLATGVASTDYDIYDMDGGLTTIFDASTDVQDGTGGDDFPIEFIGGGTFGGERLLIDRFAAGSTAPPMFNLIVFRGELDDNLATPGATRGHSAAVNAFSTAATPAAASFDGITPDGPFPGLFTAANESESFTSDGPRRIILNGVTGAELTPGNRSTTGGVLRQKPDITAADGVSCAAPGFNPFYGTSAAAPHAAAIAALIKSAVPARTPAQIRNDLLSSAIDIEARPSGPVTNVVDRDTGAGIVMAHAALVAAGATPQAILTAGTAVKTQVIGDGDAFVENNETWNLTIPLTNAGGAAATNISAVLSTSTPGVTISSPNSTYPNLAIGASGNNNTPYTFSVGAATPCGGAIQFTLTVTYTGGTSSPQTFNFTITTGGPGTPMTFSYTGPPVPIPDGADLSGTAPGAPVAATLPVAGAGAGIFDVNVSIDGTVCSATAGSTTVGLDHTFVNDLEITLISPNSTMVKIIDNTDGSGNNFCQTVLDGEGGGPSIQSVLTANAPFTGNFTPASSLSVFQGQAPNGNWQLQAQDFFAQDTGSIRAFSVVITPAVCNAPVQAQGANVTGTKTETGLPIEGQNITYTVTLTNSGPGAQADNPGNEFTDVLPPTLTLVSASAPSGTTVATVGTNTVTWNGSLAASASVAISIVAKVNPGTAGQIISNQGTISYDSNGDGTNDATHVTDDPGTVATGDPTSVTVAPGPIIAVPTLSEFGLAALCLALAGAALLLLRRRRTA